MTSDPATFESDYARTSDPREIHEFGYFWRHWLRKERFADVVASAELEGTIDWPGLKRTLANVQRELGKPYVGKNMLGAYHMARLGLVLGQVVWVLVERDPLDAAVSILDARRKHYADPRAWWSYVPLEYDRLAGLDEWHQVAGQVHYLSRLYERELGGLGETGIRVRYEELCTGPAGVSGSVIPMRTALRPADPDRLRAGARSPSARTTTARTTRHVSPICSKRSPTRADDGQDDGDAPAELRPLARLLPQARPL